MFDLYNKLVICKFDLLKILINKKRMSEEETTEFHKYLILVNILINSFKNSQKINCKNEINQIEQYLARIK